ncbi:uncharacterized protein PV06_03584 [Exophiala oligosperma]|uniref:Uncharacterized protein n=1 Tax=Exophiala oligosperma TaxID=215243 RepID=A0A0D2AZB1_9EURO|nr:uncharacterized protein PV06_03584 [Exophiala oligosperma]KIW45181.1 hypothetical protein PV06_03584 [Exophiala oligosperma]
MEEVAVFRSTKRRKISRPRHHQESPARDADQASSTDQLGGPAAAVENSTTEVSAEPDEVHVSNLVRARKNYRTRAGGVHFSTADASSDHDLKQIEAAAMVRSDGQVPEKRIDISDRFTSGTGQVVNDDHHMIAYIDSEMAKRRNLAGATAAPTMNDTPQAQSHEDFTKPKPVSASDKNPVATPQQTVSLSGRPAARQLAEVDLGSSVHDGNLARTQAALERAKLGLPPVEDEIKPPKPRKPRLGRDGKPFRPRPRKRRNSEDLARDALVEQLMRENKLDIYAANELVRERERQAGGAESGGDDHHSGESDADERMAEQFRQDFMDAMAERRQRARAKAQSKSTSGAPTESRGPKLGGSRSARAKMHQQQQQQQQQQHQSGAPGKK